MGQLFFWSLLLLLAGAPLLIKATVQQGQCQLGSFGASRYDMNPAKMPASQEGHPSSRAWPGCHQAGSPPFSPGSRGGTKLLSLCAEQRLARCVVHTLGALLDYCWGLVTAQGAAGAECRLWWRVGEVAVNWQPWAVISSSAPQVRQGSALKEMQGRISTGKAELSLPRTNEKRCYKVTCLR